MSTEQKPIKIYITKWWHAGQIAEVQAIIGMNAPHDTEETAMVTEGLPIKNQRFLSQDYALSEAEAIARVAELKAKEIERLRAKITKIEALEIEVVKL